MCKETEILSKKFRVGTVIYGSQDVYEVDEQGDMVHVRPTVTDGHGCVFPRGYCPMMPSLIATTDSRPTTRPTATK